MPHLDPPNPRPGGQCPHCGYNLTGLRRPVCPECGAAFDPREIARQPCTGYAGAWSFNRYWFCRIGGLLCLLAAGLLFARPYLSSGPVVRIYLGEWRLIGVLVVVGLVLLYYGWPSESEKKGYRF